MVCWLSCWSGVINGREVKVARAGVDGEGMGINVWGGVGCEVVCDRLGAGG